MPSFLRSHFVTREHDISLDALDAGETLRFIAGTVLTLQTEKGHRVVLPPPGLEVGVHVLGA